MKYQIIAKKIVVGTTNSGDKFLVDYSDYDLIKNYSWSKTNGYFMAYSKELKKNIFLHRLVMGVHEKECDYKENVVHHVDHNTTDNRKKNLQLVSQQENLRMCKLSKRNTSGHQGVSWCQSRDRYYSSIRVDGKLIMLGVFKKENLDAAIVARKAAETIYFQ